MHVMRCVFAWGMLLVPACMASLICTTPIQDTSFPSLVTYSLGFKQLINTNGFHQTTKVPSQETWTVFPALLFTDNVILTKLFKFSDPQVPYP